MPARDSNQYYCLYPLVREDRRERACDFAREFGEPKVAGSTLLDVLLAMGVNYFA
jgi:hypothetical protein